MSERLRSRVREVYFIRAFELGLIKIGVTNNTARRLSSLQTFSPDTLYVMGVQLCFRGGALEQELHARFASLRQRGEWFWPGRDLLDYIDANTMSLDDAAQERGAHEADDVTAARVERAIAKDRERRLRDGGFVHAIDGTPPPQLARPLLR